MSEKKKPANTSMPSDYGGNKKPDPPMQKSPKPQYQNGMDTWRAALQDQILAQSAPAPTGPVRDVWLDSLKDESLQFLQRHMGGKLEKVRREQLNKEAIEATIDRLFSCLQGFAFEFNKVAVGTELHVSGTMSGDVKEVLQTNRFREAEETHTYFRARLSTRLYTLVIRGANDLIDCFIMPVNHAMALSTFENDYKPLATIQIKITEEGILWRSAARFSSLEDICAWLFQNLVDQTRDAISSRSRGSD